MIAMELSFKPQPQEQNSFKKVRGFERALWTLESYQGNALNVALSYPKQRTWLAHAQISDHGNYEITNAYCFLTC